MSVRADALKILSEQPNKEMKINLLGRQLRLGFGVEVEDVINSLIEDGKVIYDSETDIVKILTDEEQKRFNMILEMRSCIATANELSKRIIDFQVKEIVNQLLNKAKEIGNKLKQ